MMVYEERQCPAPPRREGDGCLGMPSVTRCLSWNACCQGAKQFLNIVRADLMLLCGDAEKICFLGVIMLIS